MIVPDLPARGRPLYFAPRASSTAQVTGPRTSPPRRPSFLRRHLRGTPPRCQTLALYSQSPVPRFPGRSVFISDTVPERSAPGHRPRKQLGSGESPLFMIFIIRSASFRRPGYQLCQAAYALVFELLKLALLAMSLALIGRIVSSTRRCFPGGSCRSRLCPRLRPERPGKWARRYVFMMSMAGPP